MTASLFDVVVVGGGTAGAAAGIAAARQGAKTVVVEQLGALGGTQTQGWVTPMMPNYLGGFKLNRGVNLDILARQTAHQPPRSDVPHGDVWYDPSVLELVLDGLLNEAGGKALFNATLFHVSVEQNRVTSVDVMTRAGRLKIEGKTFIDATGDAILSELSGAEIMSGNEEGIHQPMTLRFTIGNIDLDRFAQAYDWFRTKSPGFLEAGWMDARESSIGELVAEGIREGLLEEDDLGYFQLFTMNGCPGTLAFNAPRIAGLDPLDPWQISEAYRVGRAKINRIAQFLKQKFVGFEASFLSGIAPMMGIRESRRVVGETILTADDHACQQKFPNPVARNRYPVDIHLGKGTDFRRYPDGAWHEIPYGCIVVKGFDNLWVAGRCLSADFVAQSAVRIQPVCRSLGEAAGIAAAICASENLPARDLPYGRLAEKLDLSLPADL